MKDFTGYFRGKVSEISASGEPFGLFAMVRCLVELVELVLRLMACPRDLTVLLVSLESL